MDPLSVAASVAGLLGAGAKISSVLFTVVGKLQDAPKVARTLLFEVADITAALGSLQSYVCGQAEAPTERGALILLEHVLTTLTGCVTTYSDLQIVIDEMNVQPEMGILDRLKWVKQESRISALVQRLQNHKSSLTLMLTILQCHSMQEAESSTRRLCALVEEVLESNRELADRIRGLEREGSVIAGTTASQNDATTSISKQTTRNRVSFVEADKQALRYTFEQDLQASRVYNRALANRQSRTSLTSTALYTTALSVFSNLSLSQVSNISFYALPIYSADLSNSDAYIFGEEGASTTISEYQSSPSKSLGVSQSRSQPERLAKEQTSSKQTGLLGRFARIRRPISITTPANPMHVTHVGYDSSTEEFTGLPKDWVYLLQESSRLSRLRNASEFSQRLTAELRSSMPDSWQPPRGPHPSRLPRVPSRDSRELTMPPPEPGSMEFLYATTSDYTAFMRPRTAPAVPTGSAMPLEGPVLRQQQHWPSGSHDETGSS